MVVCPLLWMDQDQGDVGQSPGLECYPENYFSDGTSGVKTC